MTLDVVPEATLSNCDLSLLSSSSTSLRRGLPEYFLVSTPSVVVKGLEILELVKYLSGFINNIKMAIYPHLYAKYLLLLIKIFY